MILMEVSSGRFAAHATLKFILTPFLKVTHPQAKSSTSISAGSNLRTFSILPVSAPLELAVPSSSENFVKQEPVTESTKKAARCFYALSQGRADSKRYPAIDPLDSYSKYLEYPEVEAYLDEKIEKNWVQLVYRGKTIVQRGKEANDQINILGDDGVPVEYHERFWKSELIDFVVLQQDAFDDIDANCPMQRQQYMYKKVLSICDRTFDFADFEACSKFFKGLINLFRQMNYAEWQSEKFYDYDKQIDEYVATATAK